MENSNARKFTKIDEKFICENCGKEVQKLGYTCRNHCPSCLHSKHVDINPRRSIRRMSWIVRTSWIRN